MSPIGRKAIQCLASLGAAVTLLLGGCHYTEEQRWAVCCVLYVSSDTSGSSGQARIIDWYRRIDFDGDGKGGGQGPYSEGKTFYSNKDDKIRVDVATFLTTKPEGRAVDYLIDLGMTCDSPSATSKGGTTRCEIELPVSVRCGPTYRFLPGTTPIPEQLQQPVAAVLHVSINLSTNTVLNTFARVDPVLGGHLCHRLL